MQDDAISREAALRVLLEHSNSDLAYPSKYDEFEEAIKAIPALDVAQVVRCKDCVHAIPLAGAAARRFGVGMKNCMRSRGDDGYGYDGASFVHPDDFCNEGRKRNDTP